MPTLRPFGNRVLLKRHEAESSTPTGIIIPERARKESARATVIAVGDGKRTDDGGFIPIDLKPGDEVYFADYAHPETEVNGVKYILILADEVLGVVEK